MLIVIANILISCRPFICSLAYPFASLGFSFVVLSFLSIYSLIKGFPKKEIKPVRLPLGLFLAALFFSIIFAQGRDNAVKELYNYLSGIMLFLFAASFDYKNCNRIIRPILQTGFIIAILAIYQYFWGLPQLINYVTRKEISTPFMLSYISAQRAFFPFITPTTLGAYLAMLIPLSLGYRKNWLLLTVIFFALLLTKSVGALISLSFGLAVYFYLTKKMDRRARAILSALAVIIVGVFAFRQASLHTNTMITFSLSRRLIYWQDTLRIIQAYPLTGVGIGNFDTPLSLYAHNSYLQIWAETGIFGIMALAGLIFTAFKSALHNLKNSTHRLEIAGLIGANCVFLIHNLADFSFFLPEVAFLWWISLGLLLADAKNGSLE